MSVRFTEMNIMLYINQNELIMTRAIETRKFMLQIFVALYYSGTCSLLVHIYLNKNTSHIKYYYK